MKLTKNMPKEGGKTIGVLDIQGSVIEHVKMLSGLDVEVVRVKNVDDLGKVCGLIIPGGESTTIGKLLNWYGLDEAIKKRVLAGDLAVWGTCAGTILLAKEIVSGQKALNLKLMDITVARNAYGRQLDSFECELSFAEEMVAAVFIRAPKIVSVGDEVEVLAEYKGKIVACRQGKLMASSFHPELTDDDRVHRYFVEMC